jgi:hypothetical protein
MAELTASELIAEFEVGRRRHFEAEGTIKARRYLLSAKRSRTHSLTRSIRSRASTVCVLSGTIRCFPCPSRAPRSSGRPPTAAGRARSSAARTPPRGGAPRPPSGRPRGPLRRTSARSADRWDGSGSATRSGTWGARLPRSDLRWSAGESPPTCRTCACARWLCNARPAVGRGRPEPLDVRGSDGIPRPCGIGSVADWCLLTSFIGPSPAVTS